MADYISIIIPSRNEERFIGSCLDSVVEQDYPKGGIEVLVVDGMSKDGTRGIVEGYARRYPYIRMLDNPKRIIPSAMNTGIRNAKGKVIMKIDAHTVYKKDYISKCVKYLDEYKADNVGGVLVTLPREETLIGNAIVQALSHPFGVGNSFFRIGCKEPMWADTVFSGCYRREVFDRFGLYDEEIGRSEDVAVNSRLKKAGGRILLVPEIVSYYYARSKFTEFCRHNFDNGYWITYPLRFRRAVFSWRHLVPLAFVLTLACLTAPLIFSPVFWVPLLVILGLYIGLAIFFSRGISRGKGDPRYLLLMPLVFLSLHVTYGLGSAWGLVKAAVPERIFKNRLALEEDA